MHGQLKVKTSAEKAEAIKKEKQKKELQFHETVSKLFKLRETSTFENLATLETLESLSAILRTAPEWFTLWNLRRKMIIYLSSSSSTPTTISTPTTTTASTTPLTSPSTTTNSSNAIQFNNPSLDRDFYKKELDLTYLCLQDNPKIYCVWHHRCWIMQNMPKPNWLNELKLCNKALEQDERNFHCWDYRRFVVKNGNIDLNDELIYTREKIKDISNFSSWHYRHSILEKNLCNYKMEEELNLVHNAIFTDPSDQSAWFYYRWPLGKVKKANNAKLLRIHLNRSIEELFIVFDQAVLVDVLLDNCQLFTQSTANKSNEGNPIDDEWQVLENEFNWISPINGDYSCLWFCSLSIAQGQSIKFELNYKNQPYQLTLASKEAEASYPSIETKKQQEEEEEKVNIGLKPLLLDEMNLMRELNEEEPNNKWVLLNSLHLHLSLSFLLSDNEAQTNGNGNNDDDDDDNSFNEEIILNKLLTIDRQRSEYYKDIHSHIKILRVLNQWKTNPQCSLQLNDMHLTDLNSMHCLSLITSLNLSNNQLQYLPEEIAYLIMLQRLNLDNNQLKSLKNLEKLRNIKEVSVQNNLIIHFHDFCHALWCSRLQTLNVNGNAVTSDPDFTTKVSEHPGTRAQRQSLSILYVWNGQ